MEGGRKSRSHDLIAKKLYGKGENQLCGGHAIASTLRGKKGLIEHYELFRFPIQQWQRSGKNSSPEVTNGGNDNNNNSNNQQPVAAAVVKVGNQLDGPIGKVHGGIIALLFDDIMGFAVVPLLFPCVTRDLAVIYKVPQPHDTFVVVRVYIDEAKTAEYEREQAALDAGPRKKRIFLRATSRSMPTGSTLETAAFTPESDGDVLYSTATITMVQVSTGPPSSRGDAMKPISRL